MCCVFCVFCDLLFVCLFGFCACLLYLLFVFIRYSHVKQPHTRHVWGYPSNRSGARAPLQYACGVRDGCRGGVPWRRAAGGLQTTRVPPDRKRSAKTHAAPLGGLRWAGSNRDCDRERVGLLTWDPDPRRVGRDTTACKGQVHAYRADHPHVPHSPRLLRVQRTRVPAGDIIRCDAVDVDSPELPRDIVHPVHRLGQIQTVRHGLLLPHRTMRVGRHLLLCVYIASTGKSMHASSLKVHDWVNIHNKKTSKP